MKKTPASIERNANASAKQARADSANATGKIFHSKTTATETNKENATMKIPKELPQELKSAVDAYLMARTLAECEREKVDAIKRRILETANYYSAPSMREPGEQPRPIKDPKDSWLMDENEFHDYLMDVRAELEKAGYEIEQQGPNRYSYKCPAGSAEYLQTQTEWMVIEACARMMGDKSPETMNNRILCRENGLETRKKFLDLAVSLVVNFPGFKSPLPRYVENATA